MNTIDIIQLMEKEDREVHQAIEANVENIALAVDLIVEKWKLHGRVFLVGAGTSGRIGVLDAVELEPTFSIDPKRWVPLIAGGKAAMWEPLEQHEDSENKSVDELKEHDFDHNDVLIAISASGSTPYSVAALNYGKKMQAGTISISCNKGTVSSEISDVGIELVVGPEIIRGSTRLKAGTAQKMVMNMISTATMIRLGKVYKNEMVDMQLINKKLVKRAIHILMDLTNISEEKAIELMDLTSNDLKKAIFIAETNSDNELANQYLGEANGHLKEAIKRYQKS